MRSTIISEIETIARERRKTLAPLTDDLPLQNSGLDSLCFAILMARLEDQIGVDPFATGAAFPVTLGDLVACYQNSLPT